MAKDLHAVLVDLQKERRRLVDAVIPPLVRADDHAITDGRLRGAFYDARPDSPTHGNLVARPISERNRQLFVIPSGVWHGAENVGTNNTSFMQFSTTLYNHESPGRYCLPVENSLIPFAFGPTPGLPASR